MPTLKDKDKRNTLRSELYESFENRGVSISDAIKSLRKILAYDQKTFADFIGISLSALRRVEQNSESVELSTITKILSKFNLELRVHTLSKK